MQNLFKWLGQHKTYLVVAAGAVVWAVHAAGGMSDSLYQQIETLLGFGGLAALHAAVKAGPTK